MTIGRQRSPACCPRTRTPLSTPTTTGPSTGTAFWLTGTSLDWATNPPWRLPTCWLPVTYNCSLLGVGSGSCQGDCVGRRQRSPAHLTSTIDTGTYLWSIAVYRSTLWRHPASWLPLTRSTIASLLGIASGVGHGHRGALELVAANSRPRTALLSTPTTCVRLVSIAARL